MAEVGDYLRRAEIMSGSLACLTYKLFCLCNSITHLAIVVDYFALGIHIMHVSSHPSVNIFMGLRVTQRREEAMKQ